jgi:cobalt/nickel transport system permease protein
MPTSAATDGRRAGSAVTRLPAHCKIVALFGFVLAVVATPREQMWAFAVHAALIVAVVAVARLAPRAVLRRMAVEVPFVFFALLLPFVATGPRVQVAGVLLSEPGLWGAWNLLAKATLGVVAAVVLALTTVPRDLLLGLQRLRMPPLLVEIASFMVRYADVVVDELRRMRIARESRAFEARHLGHARVVAAGAGALFVRSYERGERVHVAMLSRGYDGALPVLDAYATPVRAWVLAAALPAAATVVAAAAWAVA